jgi:hypothetical protein
LALTGAIGSLNQSLIATPGEETDDDL